MSSRWQHGREFRRFELKLRPMAGSPPMSVTVSLMEDGCVLERIGGATFQIKWRMGQHTKPPARWNVEPHLTNYIPYLRRKGYVEVFAKS